jgi:membrane dipeptidase
MRRILLALLMAAAAATGCVSAPEDDGPTRYQAVSGEEDILIRARRIHASVLTVDSHVDIPLTFATAEVDPGVRGAWQVDLPKMIEGGLDAAFFVVYVGQGERTADGYALAQEQALRKFDAIHRMAAMNPDRIAVAYSPNDFARIVASGKLVAAIGIENGWVIGRDLGLIARYHDLGAHYMTLAHNGHNDIADSASPNADLGDTASEHGGISEFGERVIAEMNRVGMMIDVSHLSRAAVLDAVRLSQGPVIASHSGARALRDVPRNLDDDQLRALADKGGVVQLVALAEFVRSSEQRERALAQLREDLDMPAGAMTPQRLETMSASRRAEYEERNAVFQERGGEVDARYPPTDVGDFVDHIDYVVDLIGIDHVGISSDFDGGGGLEGWNDASETFNVTLELVRRNYSESDIGKLWGQNLLRVWGAVDRLAAGLQAQAE